MRPVSICISVLSLCVLGANATRYDKNYGNKMNYLDNKCLGELESEIALSAGRLVEDEVTVKGRLENIASLAGEVAGSMVDPEWVDLDEIVTNVATYLEMAVARLRLKETMELEAQLALEKLCQVKNCCYSP